MNLIQWFKRSFENPNTSLSTAIDTADGYINSSSVTVTERKALGLSAVWACINVISETLAMLPFNPIRRDGRTTQIASDHRLYNIVHNAPNDYQTSFTYRQLLQGHTLLTGESFAFIERDQAGRVLSLTPMMPDVTYRQEINGRIVIRTQTSLGLETIDSSNVLYIPGLSWDGITAVSPIRAHAEGLGWSLATQTYGAKFYADGATLSGVLEYPGPLNNDVKARIKEQWKQQSSGLGNAHGTPVLEGGMKYNRIGIPPEEAQFIESKKYGVTEAARIFRVPPSMIADLERATFNNSEDQSINFVKYTMISWLTKWEQEYNTKLLMEREKGTYFFKFNVDALLRGDMKTRKEFYQGLFQVGGITANEIRAKEDLNPSTDANADEPYVPMNMVPISKSGQVPEPARSERQDVLLENELHRIASRELTAFKKESAKKSGTELDEWLERYLSDHVIYLSKRLLINDESSQKYVDAMKLRILNKNMSSWEKDSINELKAIVRADNGH